MFRKNVTDFFDHFFRIWFVFQRYLRWNYCFRNDVVTIFVCFWNWRELLHILASKFFVSRLHLTYMHTLYQNIYTSHDTDVTICRIAYFRSKHEIYINKTNSCRQADIKRTDAKNESLLTLFFFFYYDRFIGVIENFRFLFLFSLLMAALFLIQLFAIELCCLHNALVWNGKY